MRVMDEGLLLPRELAERLGSDEVEVEVEVIEEPGHLMIVAGTDEAERIDPILNLGRNPAHSGVRDGATHHDAYLYDGDA